MRDLSKTNELIAEARRLPEQFKKVQLGETRYLEEDALAELDAAGYLAVDVARRLADALESATRVPEQGEASAAIERVTAERDAAMARIAKAWELHEPFIWSFGHGPVQSCKWCADHGVSQEVASWPCPTVAALDGAPEPEAGTKVVIGKQDRANEDECWTFTVWDPSELEKARESFPDGTYEVVTVFGLPVEGESKP